MILLLLFSATFLMTRCFCINTDAGKTPVELIETHGYPAEIHTVVTDDGYILTVYRIPHGKKPLTKKMTRPPVLFGHGLCATSSVYLLSGNRSLAFILADNGFDVWLLNARGTTYSKAHKTLDPDRDAAKFFNFTFHEIGAIDTPNSIDHILSVTKQEKLFYIGHSQGALTYVVMASVRPEYNDKIRFAALLAPGLVFPTYVGELFKFLAKPWRTYLVVTKMLRIYEFPGKYGDMLRNSAETLCGNGAPFHEHCVRVFEHLGFNDTAQIDMEQLPAILSNYPSDASMLQIIHYAQIIAEERFQWFDDGTPKNSLTRPPRYNVSLIDSPVGLFYAKNDMLAPVEGIRKLRNRLKNAVVNYEVPLEQFNHFDFLLAKDVVTLLYNDVLKNLKQF